MRDRQAKSILTVLVICLMVVVVIAGWFNVEVLITRLHSAPCSFNVLFTHGEGDSVAVPVDEVYESEQRRRRNEDVR